MLTNKFILSFRATAIANPFSAAPPNENCDMPRALPAPSATFTKIPLIQAASTDQTGDTVLPPGGSLDDPVQFVVYMDRE